MISFEFYRSLQNIIRLLIKLDYLHFFINPGKQTKSVEN